MSLKVLTLRCDLWLLELQKLLQRVTAVCKNPSPDADLRLDSMRQLLQVQWQVFYNGQHELRSELLTLPQVEEWRQRNRRAAATYQKIMDAVEEGIASKEKNQRKIKEDRQKKEKRQKSPSRSRSRSLTSEVSSISEEKELSRRNRTKDIIPLIRRIFDAPIQLRREKHFENFGDMIEEVDTALGRLKGRFTMEAILSAFVWLVIQRMMPKSEVTWRWRDFLAEQQSWEQVREFLVEKENDRKKRQERAKEEKEAVHKRVKKLRESRESSSSSRSSSTSQKSSERSGREGKRKRSDCIFCESGGHQLMDCEKFAKRPVSERRDIVAENGHCLICMSPHHREKDCIVASLCMHCKGRHHSTLCYRVENKD